MNPYLLIKLDNIPPAFAYIYINGILNSEWPEFGNPTRPEVSVHTTESLDYPVAMLNIKIYLDEYLWKQILITKKASIAEKVTLTKHGNLEVTMLGYHSAHNEIIRIRSSPEAELIVEGFYRNNLIKQTKTSIGDRYLANDIAGNINHFYGKWQPVLTQEAIDKFLHMKRKEKTKLALRAAELPQGYKIPEKKGKPIDVFIY